MTQTVRFEFRCPECGSRECAVEIENGKLGATVCRGRTVTGNKCQYRSYSQYENRVRVVETLFDSEEEFETAKNELEKK